MLKGGQARKQASQCVILRWNVRFSFILDDVLNITLKIDLCDLSAGTYDENQHRLLWVQIKKNLLTWIVFVKSFKCVTHDDTHCHTHRTVCDQQMKIITIYTWWWHTDRVYKCCLNINHSVTLTFTLPIVILYISRSTNKIQEISFKRKEKN